MSIPFKYFPTFALDFKIQNKKTKNMKKFIFSAAVIFAAFSANAQNKTMSPNKIGLQAGTTFSTYNEEFPNNVERKSDSKFGFTVGAVADIDFGNSVSFRPELNFIQKGGEQKYSLNPNTKLQEELTLNYIQLSPNFVYNFAAGTGKFFIGVGPELSFGLGGKSKTEINTTGTTTTTTRTNTDVKFDSKPNSGGVRHLKSVDYGANALIGYKFMNGLFLSGGYTAGLNNLSNENNSSFKNGGINLKIGYMFKGTK